MSNAELIRANFGSEGERAAWRPEDVGEMIAGFSEPGLLYIEDPRWPGSGEFDGQVAVIARFAEYQEILGEVETTVESIEERGDRVLLIFRLQGRSVGAGMPFDQSWGYVYEFSERGKVQRWLAFLDAESARAEIEAGSG